MDYLNAFLCGGILCAVGQILIDKTPLTPARILTGYVVAGVLLTAVGIYEPIVEWGGAGATVPLTGDVNNARLSLRSKNSGVPAFTLSPTFTNSLGVNPSKSRGETAYCFAKGTSANDSDALP